MPGIVPVASAAGTNAAGESSPWRGWFQRTSASAATTSPEPHRHDRLVVGDELAGVERGDDLVARGRLRQRVRVHVRRERPHLALAGLLRAVHRDVGVAHQVVGVDAGAGARRRDADRGADPARLAGDRRRPPRAARRSDARPPRRDARRRPRAARRTRRRRAARRGRSAARSGGSARRSAISTASPAAWPAWSLMRLKSSRSRNSTVLVPRGRGSATRARGA